MPSPFPGMDLFIEQSEYWTGFHNSLANEINAQINVQVQPNYFARLEGYITFEVIMIGQRTSDRVRPDVSVWQKTAHEAIATYSAITPVPIESEIEFEIPLELMRVEIHSVPQKSIVTIIEILSPVNKRVGHEARQDYLRKRRKVLRSPVHWMEIDLLRGGERSPLEKPIPQAPYYAMLSRANTRPRVEVWPIQLQDKLPVLPVPLIEPDPDIPLDLSTAVAAVYERGAYGAQIDYTGPVPPPRLSDGEQHAVDQLLLHTGKGN